MVFLIMLSWFKRKSELLRFCCARWNVRVPVLRCVWMLGSALLDALGAQYCSCTLWCSYPCKSERWHCCGQGRGNKGAFDGLPCTSIMIAISVLSTKTCRARSIPQLAESLKRLAYKTASHFVSMIDGLKRLHERCGSPDFSKDTSGRRYLYDYMSLVSCLTGTNSTTLDIAVSACRHLATQLHPIISSLHAQRPHIVLLSPRPSQPPNGARGVTRVPTRVAVSISLSKLHW
jgi:hypothetical protein